jgi:multidrug efflux pump
LACGRRPTAQAISRISPFSLHRSSRSAGKSAPGKIPLAINHQGLFVATTISFNLAPSNSLSDATSAIYAAMNRLGVPATIHGTFQGTARVFEQSLRNQPYLILAALIAVYIVLGILYESYIHLITIVSTLPSAGVGAVLALMICNTEFSIIGLIGRDPADRPR